ncbi:MAG: T9SS type A sorting domain-containing protein, partial [Bacteroidales bacterium]
NIHVPYSITNTGEIEISSGTLINLSIEYPVGSPILNENIILTQNLNVGQTLTGTTANSLTLTNTGENILKTAISLVGENITDNNYTEITYNLYYYEINFPQATNDTIIVNEFPFLVYTNAIFYPTESEELLYYEWNGTPGIDNIDVINTGWLYLFTTSSYCSRIDSVYIDYVSKLNEDISKIKIYPNPARDFISIISNNPINKFEIYDSQGRLISKQTINSTEIEINIATIKEGVYYIIIFDDSERKEIFRFIKI